MITAKSLMRYLKLPQEHGLMITKSRSVVLIVYKDVDWALSIDDRRSAGRHYIYMRTY